MKRRNFCRNFLQFTTAAASMSAQNVVSASTFRPPTLKSKYKWGVLYWMPYDNNLSRFGDMIINMLIQGTQSSDIVVCIQSDYWGAEKMRRRWITKQSTQEIDVNGEDSSNVSALAAYLDWAHETLEVEHWAVIMLGHGGGINQISSDDHKYINKSRTWMGVDQFTEVVKKFNQKTDEGVELLFFQNCNKATLEVIYEARYCARYTLASQLLLGAPSFYYQEFLPQLPDIDTGHEAAMAIMDAEQISMYHTLTLIDNEAVKSIPENLSKLLQIPTGRYGLARQTSDCPTYYYSGEQQCDLLMLLKSLFGVSIQEQRNLNQFIDFIKSSVIVHHQIGGDFYGYPRKKLEFFDEICGIGLYLPETEQDASRYSVLDLYQEVDLVQFYREILALKTGDKA